MVILLPRTPLSSLSGSDSRFLPPNMISPEGWLAAGYGNSFSTDSAVTDLHEPDSPTSATVAPLTSPNEKRSTAVEVLPPWAKATERSRTERRGEVKWQPRRRSA